MLIIHYSFAGLLPVTGFAIPGEATPFAPALLSIGALLGMSSVGLYDRTRFAHMPAILVRAAVAFPLILLGAVLAVEISGRLADIGPRSAYLALAAAGLAAFFPAMIAVRRAFIRISDRLGLFRRRVLVIGAGARAAKIDALSREAGQRSFTLVGFARLGNASPTAPPAAERRGSGRREDFRIEPDGLFRFCREHGVAELVVAPAERRGLPVRSLLACRLRGVRVTDYADFWERECGQVDLAEISPSWLLFSDGFETGRVQAFLKRLFDLALAATLLALTLPLTALTALLIKLDSPGPVFYRQERVGLHGRPFGILKFRSMRTDAEKDGPRWAAHKDARVTRVGAFIRKVRIDEIPQAINVLKGEMSFVGPRPERPVFVDALDAVIPYYNERHSVKPGLTGWAQINYPYGATEADARMKLAYDLYYIKNRSALLDFIIILHTVKVLVWNEGAR